MAEVNGKKSILTGKKKFLGYILGLVATLVLTFTGKLSMEGTQTVLLVITGGYWGVEGILDLGKVIMAKKNGAVGQG
jgi:hypothetical protein